MASQSRTQLLNGAHTAGIYADLSIDGPVIGTLVAIVDRAKNLPNRKTIGKQDPYCAARLGKEAKKTTTDVRGGQTPRWDQELRFTVHDSPDYYQLKVSIFTDDKRTDLIGEAWVDLKAIIIAGGGQSDVWQTLSCRGKYAGEVRVEITFYDSRPKPEKQAAKAHTPGVSDADAATRQHNPVKRRPLPTDPVSRDASLVVQNSPTAVSHPHSTPTHSKASSLGAHTPSYSPLQAIEYGNQSPRHHTYSDSFGNQRQDHERSDSRPDFRHDEQFHTPPRYQQNEANGPGLDSPAGSPYALGQSGSSDQFASPPHPPVHRPRHSTSYQDGISRGNFEPQSGRPIPPAPLRHGVLVSEAQRSSLPNTPDRPPYREHDGSQSGSPYFAADEVGYENSFTRRSPHDPRLSDMQPSVEDVPESPGASYGGSNRHSRRAAPSREDTAYEREHLIQHEAYPEHQTSGAFTNNLANTRNQDPSTRRASNSGQEYTGSSHLYYADESYGHSGHSNHQRESPLPFDPFSNNRGLPNVPPSLVPGLDPAFSHAIQHQIYEERSQGYQGGPQGLPTTNRGRFASEPPTPSYYTPEGAPHVHQGRRYQRSSAVGAYQPSGGQQSRPRHSVSPAAIPSSEHQVLQKSVSPARYTDEPRRKSDVPFGPDSFDAYNPSMAAMRDPTLRSHASHETSLSKYSAESPSKIIMHDGREVDPSDHLPMESWAPEPEPKGSSQQPIDHRGRVAPAGAQPMPESARRVVRAARHSVPVQESAALPLQHSPEVRTPPAPSSGGRNKLQKKGYRASAGPTPSASSPLATISPENFQERNSPYTPTRGPARTHHQYDYPNENSAPYYSSTPPRPPKIPLQMSGGAKHVADDRVMAEEMSKISIGAGKSRRRGGY